MDVVGAAAKILSGLPPFGHNAILGEYFQALCLKRDGKVAAAGEVFERLVDDAPDELKSSILLSAGAVYYDRGEYETALRFYRETIRAARESNWFVSIRAQQMVAQVKVINGDPRQSLIDFENLFVFARTVGRFQPWFLHNYLNGYAYVLTLAGRYSEARDICKMVLASPYAPAYPEWRETALEAGLRGSPGVLPDKKIFIIGSLPPADEMAVAAERPQNVRVMAPKLSRTSNDAKQPDGRRKKAPVISLKKWQKRRDKREGDLEPYPPRELEDYTIVELRVRAGKSLFKDNLEKRQLVRMIRAVEAIAQDEFLNQGDIMPAARPTEVVPVAD